MCVGNFTRDNFISWDRNVAWYKKKKNCFSNREKYDGKLSLERIKPKYNRQINTRGLGDHRLQVFKSLERENEAVSDIK